MSHVGPRPVRFRAADITTADIDTFVVHSHSTCKSELSETSFYYTYGIAKNLQNKLPALMILTRKALN